MSLLRWRRHLLKMLLLWHRLRLKLLLRHRLWLLLQRRRLWRCLWRGERAVPRLAGWHWLLLLRERWRRF